jgi:3-hydroxybutyryl-CoA dehydrogenase
VDDARLVLSDGRSATELATVLNVPDVAVFDRFNIGHAHAGALALAYSTAQCVSPRWKAQAQAWLVTLGFTPVELADVPGLIVTRTLAMLINEAADAIVQGVCSPEGADAAMKLGVNYPQGPFEWLQTWGARDVVGILDALDTQYRGERYRASPWLRRRVALEKNQ